MGNTYYSIRVDSAANVLADFKAALEDTYGAYADPANLTGVRYDYDVSPYLIFRCSAISDQYIRLHWSADVPVFAYGDGVSSNDVTNPVRIMGTNTAGTSSEAHLVLGPHTLLWNSLQTTTYSRLVLIGQLTNGDYAALGAIGSSTYHLGLLGMNTTDAVTIFPVALSTGFQSAAGKLYTQRLILRNGATGLELDSGGAIASFQDVYNVSFANANAVITVGATFLITTAGMSMNGPLAVLPTGLLMTFDAP